MVNLPEMHEIICPTCKTVLKLFHMDWSAIVCTNCEATMRNPYDDEDENNGRKAT